MEFGSGGGYDLNAIYTCMIFLNNKYEIYSIFESQIGTYVYIVKISYLISSLTHSVLLPEIATIPVCECVCEGDRGSEREGGREREGRRKRDRGWGTEKMLIYIFKDIL